MQTPSAAAPHASRATRDPESRVGEFDANKSPVIQVQALSKTYQTVRGALHLFQDLNLEVEAGEMVAIVGQSGAGKSTLLHILGALDTPSTGTVYCASTNVAKLSAKEAAAFEIARLDTFGSSTICCRSSRRWKMWRCRSWREDMTKREALRTAEKWLGEVGLEDRGDHRPGELSGGEQQRVALARALVCGPRLLLADEPTGDLDSVTAGRVFDLIERLHESHGLTSIVVTHNMELAARCRRTLKLENGRLIQVTDAGPKAPQAGHIH